MSRLTATVAEARGRGGARRLIIIIVAVVFAATALASSLRTLPDTVDQLEAAERTYSALDADGRRFAGAPVDLRPVTFFAGQVRAGDRYLLRIHPSVDAGTGDALSQYLRYQLLPAVQVDTPDQASVVLLFGSPTSELPPLRYEGVTQYRDWLVYAARVRR